MRNGIWWVGNMKKDCIVFQLEKTHWFLGIFPGSWLLSTSLIIHVSEARINFFSGYSACNSAVRHVTQNLDNDYLRGPPDICMYPLLIGHADGYAFCDRISCAIDQENYHNSLGNDVSKILQNKFEDKHSKPFTSNRM